MKPAPTRRPGLNAFDGFVLAGALVNAAVILALLIYWLVH
jgi:hypothetical protein